MNGSCAGGTGAFIDQMATLMNVTVNELDELSLRHEKIYPIASRCGVFAKSDIQPILNQGGRKEDVAASFKDFFPSIVRLVKSKLFFGMALVVIMALMYEPVGFIATCLLFLIAYGLLLGQRNMVLLLVTSVLITVLLYIGFAVFLGVMLPRGQVPFLRNFALFVESLIPAV